MISQDVLQLYGLCVHNSYRLVRNFDKGPLVSIHCHDDMQTNCKISTDTTTTLTLSTLFT